MRILSVIGTRPQFLKIIPLYKEIQKYPNIDHIIVNTGQHFDDEMSKEILIESNIDCRYNLNINNFSSIQMLSIIMIDLENIINREEPDLVLVYGDCDTTLAGALVSYKLGIRLIHIESGLRSRNRDMPEEINRIMVDELADYLLTPNREGYNNLINEGFESNRIFIIGNLQIDLLRELIKTREHDLLERVYELNLKPDSYILLTIHRNYNTTASSIKELLDKLSWIESIFVFPIHPRTRKIIEENEIKIPNNIITINPQSFINMMALLKYSSFLVTDSGGLQCEADFLNKRCFTFRNETEWNDTLKRGNELVNVNNIKERIDSYLESGGMILDTHNYPECSREIVAILKELFIKNI